MKVTIKDVAELAGVSFKTVSRVVNGEVGVKSEMREKVQTAIEKLNYHPNLSARRLRGKSATIGFIYNNPNSNYVITMLHGILAAARKNSYELVVHPCENVSDPSLVFEEILSLTRRSMVAGLVLTPPISENPEIIKKLDDAGITFSRIVSGSVAPDDVQRTIFIDDRKAAYQITEHLIKRNHKRICFLNGDPEHLSSGERLEGYKAALRDYDIAVADELILDGHYTFESGVERAKQIMDIDEAPTAVFACNDEIAAGALFAARMNDVKVPEQLSIVGFEDSPFSRQTWPSLTTAKQPNDKIASHATELLIGMLEGDDDSDSFDDHSYLPEMIVRESSADMTS
jgi:LacI family transcriptional regulator